MLSTKQHCTLTQYNDLKFTDSTLLLYGQMAIKLKMELDNPLCKTVRDFKVGHQDFQRTFFPWSQDFLGTMLQYVVKRHCILPQNLSGLRQLALKTLNSKTVLLFTKGAYIVGSHNKGVFKLQQKVLLLLDQRPFLATPIGARRQRNQV